MKRRIVAAVMWAARTTRQIAAFGALLLAIRFAWLAGGDALTHLHGRFSALKSEEASEKQRVDEDPQGNNPLTGLASKVNRADNPHRPDLKEMEKQFQPAIPEPDTQQADPAAAIVRSRRLLVDIGPGRSEVYVQGRLLGHTPYVGQINCAEGQAIKIQVLPPEGAPTERKAICQGETILANR